MFVCYLIHPLGRPVHVSPMHRQRFDALICFEALKEAAFTIVWARTRANTDEETVSGALQPLAFFQRVLCGIIRAIRSCVFEFKSSIVDGDNMRFKMQQCCRRCERSVYDFPRMATRNVFLEFVRPYEVYISVVADTV
jgi:hypothetical protein